MGVYAELTSLLLTFLEIKNRVLISNQLNNTNPIHKKIKPKIIIPILKT